MRLGNGGDWRSSHQANISCKRAIEESIRQNFDGMRLNNGCVDEVIAKYGYKRTAWVLSNTIQQKDQDGRFSQANKQWAKRTCIPSDHWHNSDFVVESHPAVLDGFVTQYCKAYQALGLFGPEHCHPDSFSSLDYEGKVLVLSPDILKESYWNEGAMLWYAHDGFGCSPHWALHPLYLPGRRGDDPLEPGGFYGRAERSVSAGLGRGETGGIKRHGTNAK